MKNVCEKSSRAAVDLLCCHSCGVKALFAAVAHTKSNVIAHIHVHTHQVSH